MKDGRTVFRHDPALLTQVLQQGGVLVIDAVQEYVDSVRHISDALATKFGEKVQANCYVGGTNSSGFDLHWDRDKNNVVR